MSCVYYISPVGSDPDYESKRSVLARVAERYGVEFFFPLERRQTFLVARAMEDIRACRLVIADLSLERPSCYFELGLAQATDTPIVLIANEGVALHQVGEVGQVVRYEDLKSYLAAIERGLSSVILFEKDLLRADS